MAANGRYCYKTIFALLRRYFELRQSLGAQERFAINLVGIRILPNRHLHPTFATQLTLTEHAHSQNHSDDSA
jgi:hypothetical protein